MLHVIAELVWFCQSGDNSHDSRFSVCVFISVLCSVPHCPQSGFKTHTMQDVAVINFLDYLISFQLFKGLDII